MKILKKTVLFTLSLGTNLDIPTQAPFEFSYELLYALVPFAQVSIRGAVMGLRDESYVSVYMRDGQTRIALSSVGREALKAVFPGFGNALGRRERTWTVCLFLDTVRDVPSSSKASLQTFRPIRELLLGRGFYQLERGMYVLPKVMGQDLVTELAAHQTMSRVLIFETRRMVVGDERQIVRTLFPVGKLSALRQGIVKTLEGVEKKGKTTKTLHPQTRASFVSLVSKLMQFFTEDLPVPDLYFPQDIQLSDTKELLYRVSAEILPKLLLQ